MYVYNGKTRKGQTRYLFRIYVQDRKTGRVRTGCRMHDKSMGGGGGGGGT